MNILVVNPIMFTSENYVVPEIRTIKETMIYSMCLGFMSNGHRVTLAAAEDFKPVCDEEYEFEVIYFKSAFKRVFMPSVLPLPRGFYKYLKANHQKFDLIVSSEVFTLNSLFLSIVCPSKTVIWQEMTLHQSKFKKIPSKTWYNIIVPLFFRKIKCVIPRSRRAYTFIGQYMKNVSEEIVDHGVNVSRFGYSREKERVVISSSRLVPGKNIESIVQVYSKLIKIKGFEDIKMLIAGDGESKESLEALVAEMGLQNNVSFLGYLRQNDLNEAIKKSYVFMVNTLRDMNMVSIPESIVSGTPVITNRMPASADYIEKEKLGIAKDGWDEYDLKEIIENNEMYVDNCMNYRDKLTNGFSAQKIVETFLRVES